MPTCPSKGFLFILPKSSVLYRYPEALLYEVFGLKAFFLPMHIIWDPSSSTSSDLFAAFVIFTAISATSSADLDVLLNRESPWVLREYALLSHRHLDRGS